MISGMETPRKYPHLQLTNYRDMYGCCSKILSVTHGPAPADMRVYEAWVNDDEPDGVGWSCWPVFGTVTYLVEHFDKATKECDGDVLGSDHESLGVRAYHGFMIWRCYHEGSAMHLADTVELAANGDPCTDDILLIPALIEGDEDSYWEREIRKQAVYRLFEQDDDEDEDEDEDEEGEDDE